MVQRWCHDRNGITSQLFENYQHFIGGINCRQRRYETRGNVLLCNQQQIRVSKKWKCSRYKSVTFLYIYLKSILLLVSDGYVGQRVVSFIHTQGSVFYSEETVVAAQVGYMQLPLSDNRTTLWTVKCAAGGMFTCSSVSCPLWHHVSGVGRLLVYSTLRLTYSEIEKGGCSTGNSITVTGNLKYGMPMQKYQFTFSFGGQYYSS